MLEQVLPSLVSSAIGGLIAGAVAYGTIRAELRALRRDVDRIEGIVLARFKPQAVK